MVSAKSSSVSNFPLCVARAKNHCNICSICNTIIFKQLTVFFSCNWMYFFVTFLSIPYFREAFSSWKQWWTIFIIMQQCYFMYSSLLPNTSISYQPIPVLVLCFLCVPFMEGWTHRRHSPRWAAFMEHSAEPYFNVWAYVALCPFLDLNVYPWRPTGGEIFPDAKVMRAWTDKYRVAMAAQKIRQLSFFFLVPHKKEVFQIFSLPLLAPVFTSSRILFAS